MKKSVASGMCLEPKRTVPPPRMNKLIKISPICLTQNLEESVDGGLNKY